jgi:glycosyltransferase involved in cell wall biosynthesis
MVIGFDAKRLFNNFTGLGNYSRTLVHNLVRFSPGNEYHLYTPSITSTPETEEFTNNASYKTFVPDTIFRSFWRSITVLKQLQKDKIQIYHGLSHELPLNIQKSRIKGIVTMHDLIFNIYPSTYKFIDRNLYDTKYKYSCANSDKIIAISENTKNDIIKFYNIDPEKIEVIYQACNPLFYAPDNNNEDEIVIKKHMLPGDYVLYVGSITERKNLATIIRAYEYLPQDLKIPLVIVGNGGHYKNTILKLIESKKRGLSVKWIENLTNAVELKVLFRYARIFIYPSLYEGFGIPVIEALLCRTPVITSNVSSLPEAGGPGSFYIDPTDAEQMAAGIVRILTDTKYEEKIVETGYSYAIEKFDAEKNTMKLLALYNKIL